MSDYEKKFTDKEFRRIIEKALVLQQKDNNPLSNEVTKSELLSMASDLGIKESYLQAAMEDSNPSDGTTLTKFLGGEYKLNQTILLDAAPEIADMHEVIGELPEILKMQGSGNVSADHISWNTDSMTAYYQGVSCNLNGHFTREGKFKIEVRENYSGFAGGLYGGVIGGFGLGVGFGVGLGVGLGIGSVALAVAFPPAILLASYFLCRAIYKSYIKGRKTKLSRLSEFLHSRLVRDHKK